VQQRGKGCHNCRDERKAAAESERARQMDERKDEIESVEKQREMRNDTAMRVERERKERDKYAHEWRREQRQEDANALLLR